jgi:uncharacterized protein with beta-barrel porin domain
MKTTRTGPLAGSKTHGIAASVLIAASPALHQSMKLSRHLLAGAAVLALLAGTSALPVLADGGNAGGSTATQGTGGVSDPTGASPAIDGQDGLTDGGGGGGGAGMTVGGKGGNAGATGGGGGGGGGGTGLDFDMTASGADNSNVGKGGDGGKGGGDIPSTSSFGGNGTLNGGTTHLGGLAGFGSGASTGGGGGGGGAGGYGGVITGTTSGNALTNEGSFIGGKGGDGGDDVNGFDGGSGGDGGVGLQFTVDNGVLINTGTIAGGAGGAGGATAGSPAGTPGASGQGGEGINGRDIHIQNSGQISGGMGADGTQADAIHFISGSNFLVLMAGSQITGNVVNDGSIGQLGIETNGSNDSTFDVAQLGAVGSSSQYQGFTEFLTTNLNTGQGAGTVTLTGTTTEAFTWIIDASTALAISTDSNLGAAGSTIVMNGGTLRTTADVSLSRDIHINSATTNAIDTTNHTVTASGQILGSASFGWQKLGTGTLILNGDSSHFFGSTDVDIGTLQVGDVNHQGTQAELGGTVIVHAGGTLSGYGTLADVTNIDGIVAPGGPGVSDGDIGTLTVDSYAPGANSTFRVLLTPNGNSNLAISGLAMTHLNGKLDLLFAPGVYAANSRTVLIANDLYDGTFSSMTSNAGFATTLDTTDSQAVRVDLGGGTVSSMTVAPTDGHIFGAATSSLIAGTQIANASLFDHLSDARLGIEDDAERTAAAGGNPAEAAFAGDMAALNNIVACLPQALAKNGGWFRALGGFGNIDGSHGAPGIDSYGGGFMAGYDRALTDNFLLGAAVGYTRTSIQDDDHSSATIDTPRVSLYGSYHLGGFALDSSVGYAFDRIDSHDQSAVGDANSKHDAHEISAALQASYTVTLPNAFVLTPHAGLDYLHIFEDGFNEHGAGAFDLQADSNQTDSLRPQIGAGISRSFATDNGWHVIPAVDLTYSREVLDNTHDANVVAGGGSFDVKGVTPSRDQLALKVDLTAQLNDSVDLSLGYTDVLPVGNTASYNFTGGVRVLF